MRAKKASQRGLTSERRKAPYGHPEKRANWKNRVGIPLDSLPKEAVRVIPFYGAAVITPENPVRKRLEIFNRRLIPLLKARNRPDELEYYWNKETGSNYILLRGNLTGKKVFQVTNKSVIDVLEKMRTKKL
ncbi:MAG: hypothetical protein QT03_C0001G0473 [archaeon GW2011_AR10]|uniref:Uncharacterized protein n=1 Tax=Candidatus Iainarchaeum sp. TaxID=3101447 RepID=A0A7J4IV88_9ARCH|nr:MAG: hypothetical protein QT03_C0001G0473 [archaeon GW2011_AR10]HIH08730.1 hypothetical protein [Candidatus Diapherotrites archaeon]